jgi:ribosomal protein S2
MLDKDLDALHEIKNLKIPMIGLVDTNMNPEDYVYKFFSNNDSVETVEFLFEFLKEAVKDGRLKEQEQFFIYLLQHIKLKINR